MIFFVANKGNLPTDRTQLDSVATPRKGAEIEAHRQTVLQGGYTIIAWHEVYKDLEELSTKTIEAASNDDVCSAMQKRAKSLYGFDAFDLKNEVVKGTFHTFAHPMIGNLNNSSRARPVTLATILTKVWNKCSFMDEITKAKMAVLCKDDFSGLTAMGLSELTRADRDQAKVCFNITELARAIIGDITSFYSRKLDKLLALRLCNSPHLLTQLRSLLKDRKAEWLDAVKGKINKVSRLQYTPHYLPRDVSKGGIAEGTKAVVEMHEGPVTKPEKLQAVEGEAAKELIERLKDNSLGDVADEGTWKAIKGIPDDTLERCRVAWTRLPPVIRCAALLNDFRGLEKKEKIKEQLSHKVSLQCELPPEEYAEPTPATTYKVGPAASKGHVPSFSKGRDFTWGLNRDEVHPATITYRLFLCLLWGGPSGHTLGNLYTCAETWAGDAMTEPEAKTPSLPADLAVSICAGLFSLWRLYYDKRVSGVHTLAETFEGSWTKKFVPNPPESLPESEPAPLGADAEVDAFNLLLQVSSTAADTNYRSIDPIRLMESLRLGLASSPEDAEKLENRLEEARKTIPKTYHIPRWSKQLNLKRVSEVIAVPREAPHNVVVTNDSVEITEN